MLKRFAPFLLTLSLLCAVPSWAVTPFTPVTGADMMKRIQLGINFGNTLEARVWDDKHYGLETETFWGEAAVEPDQFAAIAKKGYAAVRLPVSWEPHMTGTYVIDEEWMDRVAQCVDWALDAGLYVILNAHHETNFYSLIDGVSGVSDVDEAEREITAIWKQVANRFAEHSEKLLFEVMNEPHLQEGWIWESWNADGSGNIDLALCEKVNRLNKAALHAIRETGGNNKKRVVLLTTPGAEATPIEYFEAINDPYTALGIFLYPPNDATLEGAKADTDIKLAAVRDALKRKIPVLIKEIAPPGEGDGAAWGLEWTEYTFGKLAGMGVPTFWWNCGLPENEALIYDRYNLEWTHKELSKAVFAAYGVTPGPDVPLKKPPFPIELDISSLKDGEFAYWSFPERLLADAGELVVELNGVLTWGYSFVRVSEEWAQFDAGGERITEEDGVLTFDFRGLAGNTLGFGIWGEGNARKVTRITLNKKEEQTPAAQTECDINGDGRINQSDLNILWLPGNYNKNTADADEPRCDINGDGIINQSDLNILWLPSNYNKSLPAIE
ncbi:MAG: cellulase family glycosylhydrolase [Oscillospiraceae bacterium]|jgi:endoglucanase|nr:cellulase family glycosylhydrolase [Oscillospiraceae bacterium]